MPPKPLTRSTSLAQEESTSHNPDPKQPTIQEDEEPTTPADDGPEEPDKPSTFNPSTLTEAITLMTNELRKRQEPSKKAKAKEPDTFDGSDPKKLNNFILLCNLYFRNNPAYSEDETKVTFALSYLRGTALEYFEPSLIETDEVPVWMYDWSTFIQNLRTQFGPIDPTADAEDGIDNLKMQENQHIVKYNVEFNRLSIRTGWDDPVLRHRYYTGLAERIKDVMGQQGKPATLEAMKTLAHAIDSRHWERIREKSRSGKNKSDNPDKSDNNNQGNKNNKSDKGKNPNAGRHVPDNSKGNNSNNNNKNNKSDKSKNQSL